MKSSACKQALGYKKNPLGNNKRKPMGLELEEEEEFREPAELVQGCMTLFSPNCPWIRMKRRNPSPVLSREGNILF